MKQWNWTTFCGHEETFKAWNDTDFGYCFEQTVILIPTLVILLVISSYYVGRRRHLQWNNLPLQWPWYLMLRFISVLGLVLSSTCRPIFAITLEHKTPSYSDGVLIGVSLLTWIVHCYYIWNILRITGGSVRGPSWAIISFLLLFASISVHVHTAVVQHTSKFPQRRSLSEEYTTYANAFLCIVYLLTLLPKGRLSSSLNYNFRVNEADDESEPLVHSARDIRKEDSFIAEKNVGVLSWLTFHWAQRLMSKGAERKISDAADLFLLPNRLNTKLVEKKFSEFFQKFKKEERVIFNFEKSDIDYAGVSRRSMPNHSDLRTEERHVDSALTDVEAKNEEEFEDKSTNFRKDSNRVLLQALKSAFGVEYFAIGLLKLFADCLGFAGPVLLNYLVSFVENKSTEMYKGYLIASGLFLSTLLGTICSTQFDYNIQVLAYKMRCALITTIYKKSTGVNSIEQSRFNLGEIVNFMSTDTDRILNFCPSFHAFWSLPFQIAVSLYLLYQQIGLAFLTGLGFALLLIPINRWIAVKIGKLSQQMMHYKDERVKTMSELLTGIRVVKFFAWEGHFTSTIADFRENELQCLKGRKYLDAMCVFFWATTPVLISILTFTTYVIMGNNLTAAKVFTSLSLFLMLIAPLNAFPWVINGLVESWVSLKRVQEFANLNDSDLNSYYCPFQGADAEDVSIVIENATFTWTKEKINRSEEGQDEIREGRNGIEDISNGSMRAKTQDLLDISLTVKKGQLIGIVGKVGSGKSSLLSAIIGEMKRLGGKVCMDTLDEGFAYAPQETWIQHATVRDNILFGCPLDRQRYEQVIDACALTDDLNNMPAGDATEIGDNGITLSGGQRARVALARAVYQEKSIYLFDDPLSAVDAHVARHIFRNCIMGLVAHKTRVLCTHHVKYLSKADWIIVMEDGRIARAGTPGDVLTSLDLSNNSDDQQKDAEEGETEGGHQEDVEGEGQLVEEEEKETGAVKADVYQMYWKAIGGCLCPLILITLLFMQASRNVSDWWLSYWVSHTLDPTHKHSNITDMMRAIPMTNITTASDNLRFYLGIYGGLAGFNLIFTLLRAFLFAYGGICAATVTHQRLFSAILKAPISFFDATPIGRIINRFSSDLYSVDDSLPFILNIFLAQTYGILGTLVITCYGLPWFMICLIPLAVIYYKIQHYYRHTSRELKRISSVTLSPIYSHFSETISGLAVIRAMRHTQRFRDENLTHLDTNQRAQFSIQVSARWLDFRLRMLGVGMVTALSFIAVLQHQFNGVNAGLVGLAISYSLSVTALLGGVVMSFTETEKEMVSVERCLDYIANTPTEKWEGSLFPPSNWPLEGIVEFDNASLQYRNTANKALDGVSFKTVPGEKVGIVGRTGAGKSSLFLALFRLVELNGGSILMDGVNLNYLDLSCVRSQLAIIPQDPFLYSGSVRSNLDPTGLHSDDELWSALDRCHLRSYVNEMGGLGAVLGQRGGELSVGQRQLICLARAMLTKAKVLCIDEATASVDLETDSIIQETIREEFRTTTVLTIAHRINTVLDSHRVLVMADGTVAEFAPPDELLRDSSSLFYQMVHENN